MKNFFASVLAAATASIVNADLITMGPVTDAGTDIAIVWIQGMDCDNSLYQTIASQVQAQGALKGQRIWIGLPDFPGDAPNPTLINKQVNSALTQLRAEGFTGDNIVMAGHSLGGVMAQGYTSSNAATIKAQFLMGSVLTREKRQINPDGTTKYNYPVPTLSIGGTKDGLLRISRLAEAFWHSNDNITQSQKNIFPVVALEGVSHAQFLSGVAPPAVAKKDLKPDVPEETAQLWTAVAVVEYLDQILFGNSPSIDVNASQAIVQPLLDAMALEGYQNFKPPCNSATRVNPEDVTCLNGSDWLQTVQEQMGGILPGTNMKVSNNDNFHLTSDAYSPEILNNCRIDSVNCVMNTVTFTQNIYGLDVGDTGYYPLAASEMKAKISSQQSVQFHAGNTAADFEQTDDNAYICNRMNDLAYQWAYKRLSKLAKSNYDNWGQKISLSNDIVLDDQSSWSSASLDYTLTSDNLKMVISSPTYRTALYSTGVPGVHYCKLLSPFKAMEWMMVDGLYAYNGIKNTTTSLFLQ